MKIAIISDTHDNLVYIQKVVDWFNENKIKHLIHCGDISTPETLKKISEIFKGEVYLVFGNMEIDREKMIGMKENGDLKNVRIYGNCAETKFGEKKIAFTHKPDSARLLAESGKYDLVFYGHTHKPWVKKIKNCFLANPGNLSGLFYQATFAVYDTENDKLELKIL